MTFFLLCRDLNKVYDGIGQKIGMFLQNMAIVLVGFIMGFVYGWKLTLVIIAISPLLMIAGGIMAKVHVTYCAKQSKVKKIYFFTVTSDLKL